MTAEELAEQYAYGDQPPPKGQDPAWEMKRSYLAGFTRCEELSRAKLGEALAALNALLAMCDGGPDLGMSGEEPLEMKNARKILSQTMGGGEMTITLESVRREMGISKFATVPVTEEIIKSGRFPIPKDAYPYLLYLNQVLSRVGAEGDFVIVNNESIMLSAPFLKLMREGDVISFPKNPVIKTP